MSTAGGPVTLDNNKPGLFDALTAAGFYVEYRHDGGFFWSPTPVETQAFIDTWTPVPVPPPVPTEAARWAWREALRRVNMLDGILAAMEALPPMWADRERQPTWTTATMLGLAAQLPSPLPAETVEQVARLAAWIEYTEGMQPGTNGLF